MFGWCKTLTHFSFFLVVVFFALWCLKSEGRNKRRKWNRCTPLVGTKLAAPDFEQLAAIGAIHSQCNALKFTAFERFCDTINSTGSPAAGFKCLKVDF